MKNEWSSKNLLIASYYYQSHDAHCCWLCHWHTRLPIVDCIIVIMPKRISHIPIKITNPPTPGVFAPLFHSTLSNCQNVTTVKSNAIDFYIVWKSSAALGFKSANHRIIGTDNKTGPNIVSHPMSVSGCIQIRAFVTLKANSACSSIICQSKRNTSVMVYYFTLFEKSNFCPKIQFWQSTNIFTSFSPQIFLTIFSWNQSCQLLKSSKPQHFHEFFTQKIDNFLGKSKLNFWTKNEDFE